MTTKERRPPPGAPISKTETNRKATASTPGREASGPHVAARLELDLRGLSTHGVRRALQGACRAPAGAVVALRVEAWPEPVVAQVLGTEGRHLGEVLVIAASVEVVRPWVDTIRDAMRCTFRAA